MLRPCQSSSHLRHSTNPSTSYKVQCWQLIFLLFGQPWSAGKGLVLPEASGSCVVSPEPAWWDTGLRALSRFGVKSWRTAFVRRLWCIAALLPRQYRFTQVRAFPWNPFLMVWGCFQPAFNCRGTRPCCYSCISPWAVVTGRRVLVVARFASLWGFPAPRRCWERRAGGKQLKCGTHNYLRWPKIRKQTVALW